MRLEGSAAMDGTTVGANQNGQVVIEEMECEELLSCQQTRSPEHSAERPEGKKENMSKNQLTWKDTMPQLYVSLCAHSIAIHAGFNMAFSAILVPELSKDHSEIPITTDQASWIASSVTMSTPIGALAAGPLMDFWGRKTTVKIACFPLATAWIVMALSSSVAILCVGRILAGIGGGLTTVALVYVSECSHPQLRPALLCLNSVAVSLGVLGTYAAFAVLPSWRWIAWCCAALAMLTLATMSAPGRISPSESPHWLYLFPAHPLCSPKNLLSPILKCRYQDDCESTSNPEERQKAAVRILRRLNPSEEHFEEARRRLNLLADERAVDAANGEGNWGLWEMVTRPPARRPLALLLILFLLQQLSGTYVIVFYAVDVLRGLAGKGSRDEANEAIALVLLGSIRLIASVVAAILSRHIGRKPLCAASGIGMFIAALASGLLDTNTGSSDSFSSSSSTWYVSICVLIHVCASALGVLVIPWTLIGELLPSKARGLGGGLSVCIAYAFMFAAIKGFPEAQNALGGTKPLFLFFSTASLVGVVFLLLCIPETLGHSLHEIETHFKGGQGSKNKWWWGWSAWHK